jgi:hypothetical protein
MSIEEIKMMAAYMTVHSDDKDECECIGSSLMNKAVATMGSGGLAGNTPALEPEMEKEFFDLMQGIGKKETLDSYKRNLIVASAIMSGNIKDSTKGATEFSKDKVKGSMSTKNYNFYTPQTAEVIAEPKSSKGRKTKRI